MTKWVWWQIDRTEVQYENHSINLYLLHFSHSVHENGILFLSKKSKVDTRIIYFVQYIVKLNSVNVLCKYRQSLSICISNFEFRDGIRLWNSRLRFRHTSLILLYEIDASLTFTWKEIIVQLLGRQEFRLVD